MDVLYTGRKVDSVSTSSSHCGAVADENFSSPLFCELDKRGKGSENKETIILTFLNLIYVLFNFVTACIFNISQ